MLVSKQIAIHLDDPEAAYSFPENSYARANSRHGQGGHGRGQSQGQSQGYGEKPALNKHGSWEDSPADDVSGRLSAGASDIELVVQTHNMVAKE